MDLASLADNELLLPLVGVTITALSVVITLVIRLLHLRGRHELPNVMLDKGLIDGLFESRDREAHQIIFQQPAGTPSWLIRDVQVHWSFRRLVALYETEGLDALGIPRRYLMVGLWKRKLTFDPPARDGEFMVRRTAPENFNLKFTIVKRADARVKRKIVVVPQSG